MIDLHMHTTASDGEFRPAEVVKIAKKRGIDIISITDHDTAKGVEEAYLAGKNIGIKIIPGIEFSAKDKEAKKVHILGYNIDYKNQNFIEVYESYTRDRDRRNQEYINKFQSMGINIKIEDVKKFAKNENVRKTEFAKALLEKGYIENEEEAYIKYINTEEFKSIKREKGEMSPKEVIEVINKFGGTAILAHPYSMELEGKKLEEKILELKSYGLKGLECFHSRQTKEQMELYEKIANSNNMIITIGSDFHGPNVHPNIEIGTGKNNNLLGLENRTKKLNEIIG